MQSDVIQKREAGHPPPNLLLVRGRDFTAEPSAFDNDATIDDAPWRTRHSNRPYRAMLFLCFRYLVKRPDRLDRGWHTAVLREVDDQLLDLVFGDAEIERAAHMDLQFGGSS